MPHASLALAPAQRGHSRTLGIAVCFLGREALGGLGNLGVCAGNRFTQQAVGIGVYGTHRPSITVRAGGCTCWWSCNMILQTSALRFTPRINKLRRGARTAETQVILARPPRLLVNFAAGKGLPVHYRDEHDGGQASS